LNWLSPSSLEKTVSVPFILYGKRKLCIFIYLAAERSAFFII